MAQAAFLPAALGLLTKHHHIVWVGKTEQGARPLIEHVRVKFVGLQECNATLPALSLGFSVPQFRGERGNLLLKIDACFEAVVTRIGIGSEISYQRCCHDVERKRAEKRAKARASDHRSSMKRTT